MLDSRKKIKTAFQNSPEPPLLYLFCHGNREIGMTESKKGTYLGIGNNEKLNWIDLRNWTSKWKGKNTLVFINGCHSIDLEPKDLSSIMESLVNARVSGIIGTEISVHTYLACEFAKKFFERFIIEHKKVGQIIKELRWELLMKCNLLGLIYTPYCSAELCIAEQE